MVKLGMMISDRYEILEKIGSGGMADVYRAKCHRLNRFVAIKFLKQEYCQDAKFVTKFRGEAQAVAGLSHPNIVGVYDVGEDDDMHYIVMEYVEGITLKKYIEQKGKLTVPEAVGISMQIAKGLDAAHRNNIVHRDIKPQNIMISHDGTAKVTDFGIAKVASANTITSNAIGSVHYISPEQARGGFSDEKSDIYSLGVSMYEMLSGILPFTGESTVAIALSHVQDDPIPLTGVDATIPKGLSDIVAKCMQKKQELRYRSAAELLADLKMFMQNPAGNYGVIAPIVNDSPTIFMKDEDIEDIKKASRANLVPEENLKGDENLEEEEEDDDSDVDPKLEKVLVIGSIVVAIIIGIVIIVMLGKFIGLWGGSSPETTAAPSATPVTTVAAGMTTVPDVTDMLKAAADVEFTNSKLTPTYEEEVSDTVEEGKVIRTEPSVGSQVDENSAVTVYLSTGPEKSEVPDVSSYSLTDAQTELTQAGFKVKVGNSVYSDTVEAEKVASTSPKAGEQVAPGSTITIYQSKGKENKYATVPSLLGMTKSQAKTALKAAGLTLGNTSTAYSSSYSKNQVCNQSQKTGAQVTNGSSVDITLSLGKETTYKYVGSVTVPNPFSSESDSAAQIKLVLNQDGNGGEAFYTATLTYADFPLTIDGVVGKSQSDGEVIVYKDGVRVSALNISFKKVAQ